MKKVIGIIGGDNRHIELKKLLERDYVVKTYALYDETDESLESFLSGVKILIGGIPFSRDGEFVNVSNSKEKIRVHDVFRNMKECKTFFGGALSSKVREVAKEYGITTYDFLDDEDFAIFNAIPSAEGAIEIAMRETNFTLHSSRCLILGYGRIGKVLMDMLKALHANVCVAARKDSDIAWIKARGGNAIKYSELTTKLNGVDIIFNTVPSLVIGREELEFIKRDTLIIDLASNPGGIDFDVANKMGIHTVWALSIPGKVAPKSVALYMLDKVTAME